MEARTGIDDHGQAGACAIVRAAFLRPQPWVNGGGLTRVIVDRPDTLRLSLATISEAGPFSRIPGVARQFALVAGRVDLTGPQPPFPAALDALAPPLAFAGEVPVDARPIGGPALALNLMVPLGAPPCRMWRQEGGFADSVVAVFACDPVEVDLAGQVIRLDAHDTLLVSAGSVALSGRCLLIGQ